MEAVGLTEDIWREILGYLTSDELFKTCLLNSALLELSLDFLYADVILCSADKDIEQTFKGLLRDQHVTRRLRKLQILPPGSRRPSQCSPSYIRKFHRRLIYLEDLRRDFANVPRRRLSRPVEDFTRKSAQRYGHVTKRTFALEPVEDPKQDKLSLSNLVELRISFSDNSIGFDILQNFLISLWKSGSVGEGLKTLTFEASAFDMPLLLLPAIRSADFAERIPDQSPAGLAQTSPLRNVAALTIRLSHSSKSSVSTTTLLNRTLRQLLERLPSLSNLALHSTLRDNFPEPWLLATESSVPRIDMSVILDNLPFVPELKRFKFNTPFTDKALSNSKSLTKWLRKYTGQLEELEILPVATLFLEESITDDEDGTHVRAEEEEESGSSDSEGAAPPQQQQSTWRRRRTGPYTPLPNRIYSQWVGCTADGFGSLTFPRLKRLSIHPSLTPIALVSGPSLSDVAPTLTSLVFTDRWLTLAQLEGIIGRWQDSAACGFKLQSLTISLRYLTPNVFDILYQRCPHLRKLFLRYISIGLADNGPGENRLRPTSLITALAKREFPEWKLTYVRIEGITVPKCLSTHPQLDVMRAFASCLNTDPVLDTEKSESCRCRTTNIETY